MPRRATPRSLRLCAVPEPERLPRRARRAAPAPLPAAQHENVALSARNIAGLTLLTMSTINVHDIVGATKLVITKSALEAMHERYPAPAA